MCSDLVAVLFTPMYTVVVWVSKITQRRRCDVLRTRWSQDWWLKTRPYFRSSTSTPSHYQRCSLWSVLNIISTNVLINVLINKLRSPTDSAAVIVRPSCVYTRPCRLLVSKPTEIPSVHSAIDRQNVICVSLSRSDKVTWRAYITVRTYLPHFTKYDLTVFQHKSYLFSKANVCHNLKHYWLMSNEWKR